jgi:hypothetical protein
MDVMVTVNIFEAAVFQRLLKHALARTCLSHAYNSASSTTKKQKQENKKTITDEPSNDLQLHANRFCFISLDSRILIYR